MDIYDREIEKTQTLQQDIRGQVRMPVERRKALLEKFERSGASGAKFARLAGIKYATFAGWALKRRRQRGTPPSCLESTAMQQ